MSEKTSVLMSVYIKEKPEYLDCSLKSLLCDQTRCPDEFILICDGPITHELENVIKKYEGLFPDILITYRIKDNQGLGRALNFGLSKCSNEIIIRADSDDVCVPNRIETQVDYLLSHPEVAIVSSYIDEFDDDWNKPKRLKTLPLNHEELVQMAKFRNPINHMAVAFRRDSILRIGSYRHIQYLEDYELWIRAIVYGFKLGNIDEVLVHARVGNGMVNRRGDKRYINGWRKLSEYMLNNGMINKLEYLRNMIAVRCFVYMPSGLKSFAYKTVLRK